MNDYFYVTGCGDYTSDETVSTLERQLHETKGAVDILDVLREEMEQWLEEAQDDSKHEALENVLGHIEVLDVEYKHRHEQIRQKLQAEK